MKIRCESGVFSWWAWLLPAIVPALALAEPAASIVPVPVPPAATQVAPNPLNDPRLAGGRILILPFEAVNARDVNFWLGKSIQQTLQTDLMAATPGRVVTDDQAVPNVEAAVQLGKAHDARYVIAGGFVTADRTVRMSGQLIDTVTGQAIAGLQATGDTTQLFQLEDDLARQVQAHLTPNKSDWGVSVPTPPQAPLPPQVDSTGVRTDYGMQTIDNPYYYSSYAAAPTTTVYGASPAYSSYVYSTYPYDYDSYYTDLPYYAPYYSYPFCGYGVGWPLWFGFGAGFYAGDHFGHHGYGYGYYNGYNHYRGNYAFSPGYRSTVGGRVFAGSSFSGGVIRSSPAYVSSYRSSYGAPYRSAAIYERGFSGGRTSSIGRSFGGTSFHSFGGGSTHSFGGGGGSHGGGGHGGGGHGR